MAKALRLVFWTALALAVAPVLPGRAIDLVGQTSARFQWTAASGPVASYVVFVARNGAAFPTTPSQTVTGTEATVTGAYGDSILVQVAARDAVGTQGPMSPVSDVVRFVAPTTPPPGTPVLSLDLGVIATSAVQGTNPAARSFTIRNTGGGTLSWFVSEGLGWLSASPTSGSATTEADTVTVSFDTTGLAPGTHNGTITVGATGLASKTITVRLSLTAAPAALVVSTTTLAATTAQGGSATQSFTIRNGGGGTLTWSVSEGASWLSLLPTSGSATTETDTVTASFAAGSLAVGTYTATIGVAASGLPSKSISVTLTVTAGARLTLSASAVALTATQGGSPATASFTVRNTGTGTLSWSVADDATWLSVAPASGTTTTETDTVNLTADVSTLAAGTHTANVVVSAAGAASAPQTVTVTLDVQSPLGVPGQPQVVP